MCCRRWQAKSDRQSINHKEKRVREKGKEGKGGCVYVLLKGEIRMRESERERTQT